MEWDMDFESSFAGADVSQHTGIRSPQHCCDLCTQNALCVTWTWVSTEFENSVLANLWEYCFLKGSASFTKNPSIGMVSGMRPPSEDEGPGYDPYDPYNPYDPYDHYDPYNPYNPYNHYDPDDPYDPRSPQGR
jgi:hypothetical protein